MSADLGTASEVLAWLDQHPTASRHRAAADRLDEMVDGSAVRVYVLRNFTIEPCAHYLKVAAYRRHIPLTLKFGGYDTFELEAADPASALYAFGPDVVLVALRLEALAADFCARFETLGVAQRASQLADVRDRVVSLVNTLRGKLAATVLLFGFEVPPAGPGDMQSPQGQANLVRQLNLEVARRLSEQPGAYFLDVDQVLARIGADAARDRRGWFVSGAPFSPVGLSALAEACARMIRAIRTPPRKCVALDADNTLWGGVIGEDGIGGISLGGSGTGLAFVAFQEALLNLRRRGILLALCTKNNLDDVLQVLREHPDQVLREQDFAAIRANWEPKLDNLVVIATELNIGIDQIALIDDSEFECEMVRSQAPTVAVLQTPADPSDYRTWLESVELFDAVDVTEEDRLRANAYQLDTMRTELRRTSATIEDFYQSLDIVVAVGPVSQATIQRFAQLSQKTNQFNLTMRRYDPGEVASLADDAQRDGFVLRVRDRFGDSGLVGGAVLQRSGDLAIIENMFISCRVLGRSVEEAFLHQLARIASAAGAARLRGIYVAGPRNSQVAEFFPGHGFRAAAMERQGKTWEVNLARATLTMPGWIRLEVMS